MCDTYKKKLEEISVLTAPRESFHTERQLSLLTYMLLAFLNIF